MPLPVPLPLPDLGLLLRRAGLTERAVLTCFGVPSIAHLRHSRIRFSPTPPPAAIAPWLFAGGGEVDRNAAARVLPLDDLIAAGLLTDGALVRAPLAILPAGPSLAVCEPPFFPDDSSHHLVSALPTTRVARWLDLATGNGWAPLAAVGRAAHTIAAELSPRAVALARLAAALSGLSLDLVVCDLAEAITGRFELVTANLPIPDDGGALIDRLWRELPRLVAPDGEAIVHSVLFAPPPLPGALEIARYTPPGVAPFAITRWRPGGPPGRRVIEITLTSSSPHVPRSAFEE